MLSLSPELLKYCVSYTVKAGDKRKLTAVKGSDGLIYFDETELSDYDKYLRNVWPSKTPAHRPHLPDAFKEEIRVEAAGECALCLANGNSCEAAHIAAVHRSKCNHPHNLIWLCANHHTKFDKGLIGPREDQNELVRAAKTLMRERRRLSWMSAANVTSALGTLLNLAVQATTFHKRAATLDKQIADQIAQSVLQLLPEVLRLNSDEKLQPVISKMKACIDASPVSGGANADALQVLDEVGALEPEFAHEAGLKRCPLCKGTRWHRESACPVCQGDGSVPEAFIFHSELFEETPCKLCQGTGRRDGEDCPACGGQGDLDAYVWESVDWSLFEKEVCTLCVGTGRRLSEVCPACAGEGQMDRQVAITTDWASFQYVTCRLCNGSGRDGWADCPACKGDGTIEDRIDQHIDWHTFKKVSCLLCKGSGRKDSEDCPACNGEREMYAYVADGIDWDMYSDCRCPLCIGKGQFNNDDCPECHGAGRMECWRAESVDVSRYQSFD